MPTCAISAALSLKLHGSRFARMWLLVERRHSKRYETKVRMAWRSFLIPAAALKTPARNGYNTHGVNLTYEGYVSLFRLYCPPVPFRQRWVESSKRRDLLACCNSAVQVHTHIHVFTCPHTHMCSQTVHIQRGHEHTHRGTDPTCAISASFSWKLQMSRFARML